MKAFYDKTGAEPFVCILAESSFPDRVYGTLSKYTLEDYAYDYYLDRFDDEGHYMIMVVVSDDGFYIWLDMAGNDTASIVTNTIFNSFQKDMENYLKGNADNLEVALVKSFENMTDSILKFDNGKITGLILIIVIFVVSIGILSLAIFTQIKRIRMVNDYCDYIDRNGSDGGFGEF